MKVTGILLALGFIGGVAASTLTVAGSAPLPSSDQCQVIIRPEGWTPDMAGNRKYCRQAPALPADRG